MKEYILIIILFLIIISFLLRPAKSNYNSSTSISDWHVTFFQIGKDIDPAVTSTVASSDSALTIDAINRGLWTDSTKSSYWGVRKVLQDGGGGAVSYLTFADDAAATAALTQQSEVLKKLTYQGTDYVIPTVVCVKKSKVSPILSCLSGQFNVGGACSMNSIKCGYKHSCVLKYDGTIYCWRYNSNGQLGNGTTTDNSIFTKIPGLTNCVSMDCGSYHTCVTKSDGTVYCWGSNSNGQIGDGTTTDRSSPTLVQGLTGVVKVSCGAYHTFAIRNDGSVFAWGSNSSGQLGDGTTIERHTPKFSSILSGLSIIEIASGESHTCAITQNNELYGFGNNTYGQIVGIGTNYRSYGYTPVQIGLTKITSFNNVQQVKCGTNYTIFLLDNGSMYGLGFVSGNYNWSPYVPYVPPVVLFFTSVTMIPITNVVKISAGFNYISALTSGGTLFIWDNRTTSPVNTGFSTAMDIAYGYDFWCAVQDDGWTYSSINLYPEVQTATSYSTGFINTIYYETCTNATLGQKYIGPDNACSVTSCSNSLSPGKYYTTPGICRIDNCNPVEQGQYFTGPGTNATNCPVGGCKITCPAFVYPASVAILARHPHANGAHPYARFEYNNDGGTISNPGTCKLLYTPDWSAYQAVYTNIGNEPAYCG